MPNFEDSRKKARGLIKDLFTRNLATKNAARILTEYTRLSMEYTSARKDYMAMCTDPLVSGSLIILTDDATTYAPGTGKRVWVEAKDKNLEKECNDLLNALNLEERSYQYIFEAALFGTKRMWLQFEDDEECTGGVIGINDHMDLAEACPMENNGQIVGHYIPEDDDVVPPWRMLEIKLPYMPVSELTNAITVEKFKVDDEEVDNTYVPGTSFLETSRRTWRNLRLMEDAMTMLRLDKGPTRHAFMIQVDDLDSTESVELLALYRAMIEDDTSFSMDSGLQVNYNKTGYNNDLYIPVRGNVNDFKIEELSGGETDVGRIVDIEYFQKKIAASLGVPLDYLGFEEGRGGIGDNSLLRRELRYARTVKKLKKSFMNFVKDLCLIHLYSLGNNVNESTFKVCMDTPSTAEDEERYTALDKQMRAFSTAWALFDRVDFEIDKKYYLEYLMTSILSMPGFNVNKFLKNPPKSLAQIADESKDTIENFRPSDKNRHHWAAPLMGKVNKDLKLVKENRIGTLSLEGVKLSLDELQVLMETGRADVEFAISPDDYGFSVRPHICVEAGKLERNVPVSAVKHLTFAIPGVIRYQELKAVGDGPVACVEKVYAGRKINVLSGESAVRALRYFVEGREFNVDVHAEK